MEPGAPGHGRLPRGWYNDPWGPGLRYWDGEAWTALSGAADERRRGRRGVGFVFAVLGLVILVGGGYALWWLIERAGDDSPEDRARAGTLQVEDLPLGWRTSDRQSRFADLDDGQAAVGYAVLPERCQAAVAASAVEPPVATEAVAGSPVFVDGSASPDGIAVGASFVFADDDTARRLLDLARGATARACIAEDLSTGTMTGFGAPASSGELAEVPGPSYADGSVQYRVVQQVPAPGAAAPRSVVVDAILMRAGPMLVQIVLAGSESALPASEREAVLTAVARRID